jgi:hypothetical protein
MDQVIQILNGLALIVPVLLAVGVGWKYLPVVKHFVNEGVIPILNALVTFFLAFGGGATAAHAGFFGDLGHILSVPGQMVASVLISYLTSRLHDKFLKPITPQSPATRIN